MDWMLIWTAVAAICVGLGLLGSFFGWLRHLDWRNIRLLKDDSDTKIGSLKTQLDQLGKDLQSKVEKDEHNKDIALLRDDLKNYTNRLDAKLDQILNYIMNNK